MRLRQILGPTDQDFVCLKVLLGTLNNATSGCGVMGGETFLTALQQIEGQ